MSCPSLLATTVIGFLLSQLSAQDTIELQMKRIADTSNEAEAQNLLQDFFRRGSVFAGLRIRLQTKAADASAADELVKSLAYEAALRKDNASARLRAGSARMFRETGRTNLNSGSTSAVAKTSTTEFLSMALESGAITSNTHKSTATFQVNSLPTW
jgi:hypothetical protein